MPRCTSSPASPNGPRSHQELGGDLVEVIGRHHRAAGPAPDPGPAQPDRARAQRRPGVCTGAELEIGWLPVLLQQSGNAEGAAGPARQLRGRPTSCASSRCRRSSTARRATCMPPATRTSRPTRATSRRSPPRSRARLAQIDPAQRRRLRQARTPTSRSAGSEAMRALGRAGRAAEGRGGGLAAQGLRLPVRLARAEGSRRCSNPSPASSRRAAHLQELLATLKATPAQHGAATRPTRTRAPSEWLEQERRHPGGEAAVHRRRQRRRQGPVRPVRRHASRACWRGRGKR